MGRSARPALLVGESRRLLFHRRRHQSDLIVRPFSGQDEATPNANGTMVSNLVALYLWTGEERYRQRADAILRGFAGAMAANVLSHAGLLAASLDAMAPAHIVLIAPKGKSTRELRRALSRRVAAECGGAGGEGRGVGRRRPAGIIAGAWQDRSRRQAYGFRLHRPAMLFAGDGACDAGRDGEGRAAGHSCLNVEGLSLLNFVIARLDRATQQTQDSVCEGARLLCLHLSSAA